MIRRLARMTVASLKRHLDHRLNRLDRSKADRKQMDARFGQIDTRFEALDVRLDRRFGEVDRRFDSLNEKIDALHKIARESLDLARKQYKQVFATLHEHESRIQVLERRGDPQ